MNPCATSGETSWVCGGAPAFVVFLVPSVQCRGEDHDAALIALHGRSIPTLELAVDAHAADPEAELNRLMKRLEEIVGPEAVAGRRVGLWAAAGEGGLALAAARACGSIRAVVLVGGVVSDEKEAPDEAPIQCPPCLFVIGPDELERVQKCHAIRRGSPEQHRVEMLPPGDEPLPQHLGELCARRAGVAAQWFVEHLCRPTLMPLSPFHTGGPFGMSSIHLAEGLAPRRSEVDGRTA